MIVRILFASLALSAAPALAGTSVADTHVEASGPSGKMAHRTYRPIARDACRASVMHTIPAGKLHHWAAAQDARCASGEAAAGRAPRAAAPTTSATARD